MKSSQYLIGLVLILCSNNMFSQIGMTTTKHSQSHGSKFITSHGYENCIELSNSACRVVLDPNFGGRVLVYEIDGKNALYVDPEKNGFIPVPGEWRGLSGMQPSAGRFDIGPERIKVDTKLFWLGKWNAEITGNFSATLTSQINEKENLQVVRDFELDPNTTKFKVTQTIKNLGTTPKKLCYWSRTFATGGGICIVPLSNPNRFPKGYISYSNSNSMLFMPEPEENIKVMNDYLLILGPVKLPKMVFDSDKGWLGYITKDDMLFVKTYEYNKNHEYGEMAAVPLSIWYHQDIVAELEPIGPWEWIAPKGESSFSETWHLLPYDYPENKEVDVVDINDKVKALE
jgi:hypothetical protein